MINVKERMLQAFEKAKVSASIKKSVQGEFDLISRYLHEITGGNLEFGYKEGSRLNYQTETFVYIKHVLASNLDNAIFLFGFTIDDIAGYPVLIEDDDNIYTIENSESLKEDIVLRITNQSVMLKILDLVDKVKDIESSIPF